MSDENGVSLLGSVRLKRDSSRNMVTGKETMLASRGTDINISVSPTVVQTDILSESAALRQDLATRR